MLRSEVYLSTEKHFYIISAVELYLLAQPDTEVCILTRPSKVDLYLLAICTF